MGATMGSRVQAMDGQISLRQKTEQLDTMKTSWADRKGPSIRGDQPLQQLHQRWRRGRRPERRTGLCGGQAVPHGRKSRRHCNY